MLLPKLLWTVCIWSHFVFLTRLFLVYKGEVEILNNPASKIIGTLSLFGVIFTWVNVFM